MGFALTEAALRNGAESVVIASSSSTNVQKAKERLPQDLGKIESGVVDVSSTKSLQAFLDQVGTYDHLGKSYNSLSRLLFRSNNTFFV